MPRASIETEWVPLPCVCANVRRLARVATRLYDDELRPAGLEVGQFALLATLRRSGDMTQRQLALGLGMDTSSLTRTLALLSRQGWISRQTGADRRSRVFSITAEGSAQFKRALPYWQRAQQAFSDVVGVTRASQLSELVNSAAAELHRQARRRRPHAGQRDADSDSARRGKSRRR
jgi:DNA-binding MarR family transcriptional regulator